MHWVFQLCLVLCFGVFATSAQAQALSEEAHWSLVQSSNDLAAVEDFIAAFPEGQYLFDALRLTVTLKEDKTLRDEEARIFDAVGPVRFTDKLQFGTDAIVGKSLDAVLRSSPTFPPVDGLPEAYWKAQTCSNCHDWTRDTLCVQGMTYIDARPTQYRDKKHPFGGTFKTNMRNWAMTGCQ